MTEAKKGKGLVLKIIAIVVILAIGVCAGYLLKGCKKAEVKEVAVEQVVTPEKKADVKAEKKEVKKEVKK